MTEKRFKVHSMIRGMNIGETMDLELCEELIKKYGSSSDIDLLITNNGNNMTYQEVADLLNENEQLKSENEDMKRLINNISLQRDEFHRGARENANRVGKLKRENKELKEEHERVIDLLNKKLHENDDNDEYTRRVKINLIMELKKELGQ